MTAFNQKIQTLLDKGQGPAARALEVTSTSSRVSR